MSARNKGINLVPEERKTRGSWEAFLDWLLNIGRYLIIFTELIVISAFLIRFKLDHDLNRLYEEIEIKKATIIDRAEFEEEFRFLQSSLEAAANINRRQEDPSRLLEELAGLTPVSITLESLKYGESRLGLTGRTESLAGLAILANNLNLSPHFDRVAIGKISKGNRSEIQFDLSATWQESE